MAGVLLCLVSGQWWLLIVGALAVVAAWAYTATANPYGYKGWGELMVWVFFGPVATLGTLVTQAGTVTWWAIVAAAGVGLYAVALLMVNNIRDREGDELAGKRTLAVRLGNWNTRRLFVGVVIAPIIGALIIGLALPWAMIAALVALPAVLVAVTVSLGASGVALKPVFHWAGRHRHGVCGAVGVRHRGFVAAASSHRVTWWLAATPLRPRRPRRLRPSRCRGESD